MQPFCFGKENKEKKQHGIVGYITIWEGNSKHTWVGNSLYKMQNYLEHHKKTVVTYRTWLLCWKNDMMNDLHSN